MLGLVYLTLFGNVMLLHDSVVILNLSVLSCQNTVTLTVMVKSWYYRPHLIETVLGHFPTQFIINSPKTMF